METVTVLVVSLLVLVVIPTSRRVLAFHAYALKYFGLWALDACGLRRLVLGLLGRPRVPLTRPYLVRRFCEDMGPTFVKLGQVVASSDGLFPARYVEEFRRCLDRVPPFALDAERLAQELDDTGLKMAWIDSKPLASASVAQVHAGLLHDGRQVVVKVQRPGIAAKMATDVRILRWMARLAVVVVRDAELANPVGIVDDFAATLTEELDFWREATNLQRFNAIMIELGESRVRAPIPYQASRRVLVMERFFGTGVDRTDKILATGIDAEAALARGVRSWLQCLLLYGFFHGDVHAGNLMLLESGDVGFLDFGIVGHFDDNQRELVTDYMVAFATGDYRTLARVTHAMGGVSDATDLEAFSSDLAEVLSPIRMRSFGDVNYAELVPAINRVATRHRMRLPREFVLVLKQYVYFDRYAKRLAPGMNIFTDPRLIMGLMSDIQRARAKRRASHVA